MHCKQHKLSRGALCALGANVELNIVYKNQKTNTKKKKPEHVVNLVLLLITGVTIPCVIWNSFSFSMQEGLFTYCVTANDRRQTCFPVLSIGDAWTQCLVATELISSVPSAGKYLSYIFRGKE